jgi:hypothetical protein
MIAAGRPGRARRAEPNKDIAVKSGAQTLPACLIERSRYWYCTQALDLGGKGAKLQAPKTEPQRAACTMVQTNKEKWLPFQKSIMALELKGNDKTDEASVREWRPRWPLSPSFFLSSLKKSSLPNGREARLSWESG